MEGGDEGCEGWRPRVEVRVRDRGGLGCGGKGGGWR